MTNTLPALANRANYFLISANGQELVRFCDAGNHQMLMTRFAIKAGEWQSQGGGFDWTGRARERYQFYTAKGYRKIA